MADYDNHTIDEWIAIYSEERGIDLNAGTVRKRRAVSGLGRLVPPRTYLLSREEFDQVLATPLPFCNRVISGQARAEG